MKKRGASLGCLYRSRARRNKMARQKFLPNISGNYIVTYGSGADCKEEKIVFDAKKGKWIGTMDDKFYKTEIMSWYDAKYKKLGA